MANQLSKSRLLNATASAAWLVLATVLLVACAGNQTTGSALHTPTAAIAAASATVPSTSDDIGRTDDPAMALAREALMNMLNLESVHFETHDTLASVEVYPTEGDYVRPRKARGVIHKTQETTDWVMWGEVYYVRPQGQDRYVLAGSPGPPGVFLQFDLLMMIERNIVSADIISDEQVNGADTSYVKIHYDMRAFPDLAYLSPGGKGRVDIWVGQDTKYIHKLGL